MIRSKPNTKEYDQNYDEIFKKKVSLSQCFHSLTHKKDDCWECFNCGTRWSLDGTKELEK